MNLALVDDNSNQFSQWLSQKSSGVKFPIPFDVAWQIAGYSRKDVAKRKLSALRVDVDFSTEKWKSNGGRDLEVIHLSVEAFKHICLMAETEQGRNVRNYFIDAQEKWEMVKQIRPDVAEQVEVLKWQHAIVAEETKKAQAEQKTIELRHYVATSLPKPLGDRILGVKEILQPEYIERTITPDGEVCEGVGITYIQKRYGFKSTKEAWGWLERIGMGKLSKIWKSEKKIVEASVIPRDCLKELDALFEESPRQMFLGE